MVSNNAIQFLKRVQREPASDNGLHSIEPFSLDERDAFLELEGYGLISGSTYKGGAFVRLTARGRKFLSAERPHKKAISYLTPKLMNVGTLLAGLGGVLAGAAAMLQFATTPKIEIDALPDLNQALSNLSQSITLNEEFASSDELKALQNSFQELEASIGNAYSFQEDVSPLGLRPLNQAIGKTNHAVENCAKIAANALESFGATTSVKSNLKNWSASPSGSVTVIGKVNFDIAKVVCRPFGSELVVFSSNSFEDGNLPLQKIWDSFYAY